MKFTDSWEREFFETTAFTYPFMNFTRILMTRVAFRVEHCKFTMLLQWIHINFLEFIRTVLLHMWKVDDRKRSDFGLVCWLSRLASPGFVSSSPDSISLCAAELFLQQRTGFNDFLMVLLCIHGVGFSIMMALNCRSTSAFALKSCKYRSRIIQQAFVISFPMLEHK